jgi:ureidoglycolate lyase
MTETRLIPVRPLTPEAFAPYGRVFMTQPAPTTESGFAPVRIEESDFSGGRAIMQMMSVRWRELAFTHMEQHASFTQAFLPADGRPAVFVVTTPVAGPGSLPDFTNMKAFLLDGTQGILLGKGVWHCPIFSVTAYITYAMVTCIDTPKETEGYLDVSALAGASFRMTL